MAQHEYLHRSARRYRCRWSLSAGGATPLTAAWTLPPVAGDVADHATLLCSLLLGFNLDAYVVVGTAIDAAGQEMYYCWVITLGFGTCSGIRPSIASSSRGAHTHMLVTTANGRPEVLFWESETGRRCLPTATTMHGLRFCRVRVLCGEPTPAAGRVLISGNIVLCALQVGCVFNHSSFYANIQKNDAATACVFDLENAGLWKAVRGSVWPCRAARAGSCASVCQQPESLTGARVFPQMEPRVIESLPRPPGTCCACGMGVSHVAHLCALQRRHCVPQAWSPSRSLSPLRRAYVLPFPLSGTPWGYAACLRAVPLLWRACARSPTTPAAVNALG